MFSLLATALIGQRKIDDTSTMTERRPVHYIAIALDIIACVTMISLAVWGNRIGVSSAWQQRLFGAGIACSIVAVTVAGGFLIDRFTSGALCCNP